MSRQSGGGGDRTRVVLLVKAFDAKELAEASDLNVANALQSKNVNLHDMTLIDIEDQNLRTLIMKWNQLSFETKSKISQLIRHPRRHKSDIHQPEQNC